MKTRGETEFGYVGTVIYESSPKLDDSPNQMLKSEVIVVFAIKLWPDRQSAQKFPVNASCNFCFKTTCQTSFMGLFCCISCDS